MADKMFPMDGMAAALAIALAAGCSSVTPVQTPPADGGPPPLNNCGASDFVDRSAMSADRSVNFGGQNGSPSFRYAPQCITIAAGQSVTFNGSFAAHPLSPGTNPAALTAGSPGNPIQRTGGGTQAMFTFPTAGTYPYFCEMHYAAGMVGVVQVH